MILLGLHSEVIAADLPNMALRKPSQHGLDTSGSVATVVSIPQIATDLFCWAIAPLTVCFLASCKFVSFIWNRIPPLRWAGRSIGFVLQLMLCIQITFFAMLFFQMAWSLLWIGVCFVSDFIQTHSDTATLRAFLDRYYWP